MTNRIALLAASALVAASLASFDADAAKRFGGGSSLGKQRATPTQREAAPAAPAAPASPAQNAAPAKPAAPAATPAAPAPKPAGFLGKFGGLIAGFAIGAALMSLFGGGAFGTFMAGLLMVLAVVAIGFFAFRLLAGRGRAKPAREPVQFAGVGSAPAPSEPAQAEPRASRIPPIGGGVSAPTGTAPSAAATPVHQPSFEPAAFLRVAKTSFIRLQAANDAKDLDDIRDFTTPELYAALAMQIAERGDEPQRTEVVSVDASLAETAMEDGFEIASVRFTGLIRETPGAQPEAFDEIWHVRRKASDPKAAWLIMGIQQVG